MDAGTVRRANAAASSLARALGLQVDQAVVIHNSNKLALHLLPCEVFARIAPTGQEVAALELAVARGLAAVGAPVALPEPRVEPRAYDVDGFVVTFWTYYAPAPSAEDSPAAYADALQRLHTGMRSLAIRAPHFSDRVAEAQHLVTNRDDSPALIGADRRLLLSTLDGAARAIRRCAAEEQLLHGEPHPGNLLRAPGDLVFIDFETCCIGPIEFDVAHVPDDVSAHCRGLDHALLGECRRLVLAMVAAWRWDARDEFPNGHDYGRAILQVLREGPPWPPISAVSIE